MSNLVRPPSLASPAAVQVHTLYDALVQLTHNHVLTRLTEEIAQEVYAVLDPTSSSKHFHDHELYWIGWTGDAWLHEWFPDIPVHGFPRCLEFLFLADEEHHPDLGWLLNILWQSVWADEILQLYPSPYTVFIRDIIHKNVPDKSTYPLQVRPKVIEIERRRTQDRLRKGLETPKLVSRQVILNGVKFALTDLATDIHNQGSGTTMTSSERACFVLTQLICGSRFRGIAHTNQIVRINEDKTIVLTGLSKWRGIGESDIVVRRPLNLDFLDRPNKTEALSIFLAMFNRCKRITNRITDYKQVFLQGELKRVDNLMRKQLRTYMEQIFPGLLNKGESTHLLRKLYLVFAHETYGGNIKETGFASQVFGHTGYNTALHYTTLILK